MSRRRDRRLGDLIGVGAVASFVVSGMASDSLKEIIGASGGGLVAWLGVGVALTVLWLVLNVPRWPRGEHRRPAGAPTTELGASAEQAEYWQVALGSDVGGMAAAEWFDNEEPKLRKLVARHAADPAAVDDVAQLCDALEAWYVRQRRPAELLDLSERLATIGDQAGRRDLKEIAAARAATAHRLAGDLDAANRELGRSAGLAAHGRAAAALKARRQIEWGLANLARADRCEPGADFEEHVTNARDRLEDAAATLPRNDLAGATAVQLGLGIVALYRQDGEQALDHLLSVAARARATRDRSTEAHAQELAGVAAWSQDNVREAVAWWQAAERLYADIDEREGRGRCLQHLGSAALANGVVAGLLRRDGESGQAVATRLLKESARLRGGAEGHQVLQSYLTMAQDGASRPPPPSAAPTPRLTVRDLWRWVRRALSQRGPRPPGR
ncbi:MAG TPA: hypothetical protein VLJ59_17905 [Mycobacteriales bacterium]|nr:hypothetical protein [Mycobacteriales bacterium]